MPLSFSRELNMADIADIQVIVNGKVWRIKGRNNDDLIIKTEGSEGEHNPSDIKHVNKIVRAAIERDRGLIGKLMTQAELKEIGSFCNGLQNKEPLQSLIASLDQPFFKMVVARDLVNLGDLERLKKEKKLQEGRALGQLISKALEMEGGYETLGRIFSADLFNNNKDRFDNDNVLWQMDGTVIKNTGNVMFALAGIGNQTLAPVGMDNYDAQNEFRRLNVSNPQMEGLEKWTGIYLRDDKREDLGKFLERIVQSLHNLLNAGGIVSKISEEEAARRMQEGIKQGKSLIKYKLYRARNIPINVSERMKLLGWSRDGAVKLIDNIAPSNNLLTSYTQRSRWSITKTEKNDTVDKLWAVMGDAPESFDRIVHALVCFKMSRKSGAERDAELALSRVESSLGANGLDLPSGRYPNTAELMALVKNRSFLVQRALPDTFKKFLLAIPPTIRSDIFSENPKTDGIAVAETVTNIRTFLTNNGVPVQVAEPA